MRNSSIQRKFIIVTLSAVIVIMIFMGFMITRRESIIIYRDIERQGKILAETLAIPVMNDLIYEKLGLVEEGGLIDNYVTEIFNANNVDLLYLAILDDNGRVVSHNDFNEYGKLYNDSVTLEALSSDSTVVQKFYDERSGYEALDFATPLSIGKKRWGTLKFAISLKSLKKEIQAIILNVIIVTCILMVVSFGLIVLLSKRFISPITDLARTMENAGGDMLDVQVDIKGEDELALLGQSFNSMIERIRKSNLKLKQTHEELLQFVKTIEKTGGDTLDMKVDIEGCDEITLLCDSFNSMIDRIRESNLELKRTHEKLLQSQKLASMGILASGVAHEINNPLGGMFNCVQMLEQKGEDRDFRDRYLRLIKDGLSRIETTVGKLLWMSKAKEKKPQSIKIKESLIDVSRFIDYKLKQSGIAFGEHVENGIAVLMDPHDLHMVMLNLLINAMQSIKNGGTVSVNAFNDDSKVVFEISDTGEGIEEKNLDKIFDPFYTTKQPGEGTGLGLWVVYEIVKHYDGEIQVHSRIGEGTTFTLRFNRGLRNEAEHIDYRR
jgi:signal transduction histidine kinase